jgi:hypothetical protein
LRRIVWLWKPPPEATTFAPKLPVLVRHSSNRPVSELRVGTASPPQSAVTARCWAGESRL